MTIISLLVPKKTVQQTDPEDLNAPENTERKCYLQILHRHSTDCGAVITERNESASGSMLSIKLLCIHGHETLWNSQPLINKTPAGNILIAASILFSDNTFAHINEFCSCFQKFVL